MKNLTRIALMGVIGLTVSFSMPNFAWGHCGSCGVGDDHDHDHKHEVKAKLTSTDAPNIVETAVAAGTFNTLVAAVKAGGLVETLSGKGPFTVFAPSDEAFAKLPKGTVESLLLPENKDKLVAILTYHVVAGKVMAADVVKIESATTVQGADLAVKVTDAGVQIGSATVVATDVKASNGVIHVIDTVLMPPSPKKAS